MEHSRDAMTDIVANNMPNIPSGDENTDNGIDEIQNIATHHVDMAGQYMSNKMYQHFQNQCGKATCHANHESKHHHKVLFLHVVLTPVKEAKHQIVESRRRYGMFG
jgi:hypothetical protein